MPRLCPPARLDAAMTAFEEDPEDGLERLAELARRYAKDPAVQHGYGVALLDRGWSSRAVDPLEFAERKRPDEDVRDALLDTYFELGMVVHAERLVKRDGRDLEDEIDVELEMTRNHGPDWRDVPRKDLLAFERARVALIRGDGDAAERIAQVARRHPHWLPPLTALAALRSAKGDLEGFYAAADRALEAGPRDAHALSLAARAALLRDGVAAARALRDRLDDAASHRGVLRLSRRAPRRPHRWTTRTRCAPSSVDSTPPCSTQATRPSSSPAPTWSRCGRRWCGGTTSRRPRWCVSASCSPA